MIFPFDTEGVQRKDVLPRNGIRTTNAILCKRMERRDNWHIVGSGKCQKFRKALIAMEKVRDFSGWAAKWACGPQAILYAITRVASCFMWAKVSGVFLYSFPPSLTLSDFDNHVRDLRERSPRVITDDHNASALDWGSKEINAKGCSLLGAFRLLNILLPNEGDIHPHRKGPALARYISWQVSEDYTYSE